MEFGYEKLDVTKISKELILEIYRAVSTFPADEQYALTGQIRRAAISITLNLAEGSAKETSKDFNKFVRIA